MEQYEREEFELRRMAQERQREIDSQFRAQDMKLREQDMIIKAQMSKISQQESQIAIQQTTISEYQDRFCQVKDAVQSQAEQHKSEVTACQLDLAEWQDRHQKLELAIQKMAHERSDLLGKIKDLQWRLDQESKRSQSEIAANQDRLALDKQSYVQELDAVKREIFERHAAQLSLKNNELIRSEGMFAERLGKLDKEVARLELSNLQQKQVEDDLRQKNELLSAKNEKLRLELFSQGDTERKQSIELQLKLNELSQHLEMREQFSQKQQHDWQLKLQELTVHNERLQLELHQTSERLKHSNLVQSEKVSLEVSRVQTMLSREVDQLQDQLLALTEERDALQKRYTKLQSLQKDNERESKREMAQLYSKFEEAQTNFDLAQRESRAQLLLKNKEVLALREDIETIESKLNMKVQEARQLLVQNQLMGQKYDDALQELDRLQQWSQGVRGGAASTSDLVELLQRDIQSLRNENEQLKGTLKLSTQQQQQNQPGLLSSGLKSQGITPRSNNLTNVGEREQHHPQQFDRLPFSPIDSTSVKLNDSQQQQQLVVLSADPNQEQLVAELDFLRSRIAGLESENSALILKVQTLEQQLLKQINVQRSIERVKCEYTDQIQQSERECSLMREQLISLQAHNSELEARLGENEQLVAQLRTERDKILEVSQNLKVQLINSEKKAQEATHSNASNVQLAEQPNLLKDALLAKPIEVTESPQPGTQRRQVVFPGGTSDLTENFQPNMRSIFDASILSGITGMSQQQLSQKLQSPLSTGQPGGILKRPQDTQSPPTTRRNMTFGQESAAKRVVFEDDRSQDSQTMNNIRVGAKLASQQARTQALERLQQLKKTYTMTDADEMVPTSAAQQQEP